MYKHQTKSNAGKTPSKVRNEEQMLTQEKLTTVPQLPAESCWYRCWTRQGCCRLTVPHTHTETSCLCPWAPPPPPVSASPESAPASRYRPASEMKRRQSSWRSANSSLDYGELESWKPGREEPTPSRWNLSTAAGMEGRCREAVERKKNPTTQPYSQHYLII